MANVLELLLKVGAQLGGNFNSTFDSAQKKLSETQKEIQNLSKVQGNISAYQKQEEAMAKCKKQQSLYKEQISNLKKELQALTKENGQHGAGTANLANKILDLQKKMSGAAAEEDRHREALKNLGNSLKEAGINTKDLSNEIKKLEKDIKELRDEQEETADASEEMGDKTTDAFKELGEALAAAGIIKVLKEGYDLMVELTTGAASYADEIGTVSVQYGIAAEDLQAFSYAAELVDVSQETLTSTMSRNIRAMNSARDGTESYVEAYEKLGVKVVDADGQLRDAETVYWEVIDALGAMENETERDAVAIELLGRSAQQVNTLVAAGSGVIKEYAAEAKKAGYVMNDETLEACMALDDELQRQNSNMTALKNTIGGQLAPTYTLLKEAENEALVALTGFVDEHPGLIKGTTTTAAILGTVTGGLVALTGIVTKVIPLIRTLGATMTTAIPYAGPILAVTAGIAAVAGIIVAASEETEDAYANLTATSRKQALELEELKKEYTELTEAEGKNTYEAWLLEEQIKSLSEEYEASKQTIEEHKEALKEAATELFEISEQHDNAVESIDNEYESSIALISKLQELAGESENVAQKQALIAPIIDELNSRYEDLGLTMDYISGKLNITIDELREFAKAEANAQERQADWDEYVAAIGKLGATETDYNAAIENLRVLEEEFNIAKAAFDSMSAKINNTHYVNDNELKKDTGKLLLLRKAMSSAKNEYDKYQNEVNKPRSGNDAGGIVYEFEKAQSTVIEYEKKYGYAANAIQSHTESIIAQAEEFGKAYMEAYSEAYDAAYDSITGQFDLWENAAEVVPKSITDINNALVTQTAYWSDYNKDMSSLLDRGKDIEGLADVIATFADGSEESVNVIAGMAAASDEDLKLMVENFAKMEEQQASAAKSLAEATSEELDAIEKDMIETIENLDLSSEAEAAAKATMDAYVKALREGSGNAANLLHSLAMTLEYGDNSPPQTNSSKGRNFSAYASGTTNARSGLALVGEEGPEMIDFAGGEAVYNVMETERMLRTLIDTYTYAFSARTVSPALPAGAFGNSFEISIAPVFQISGEENTSEKLEEYSDTVVDRVLEKLSAIGVDAKRGAFA